MLQAVDVLLQPLVGGFFGGFIGLYLHARKYKAIKRPRKLRKSWDLGFLYDCMDSAFGAFALVLALNPGDPFRVFLVALLGALNAEKVMKYLSGMFNQITNDNITKSLEKEITMPEKDNNKKSS
nr:DUF4257 domain-containing protein [Bacillus sp. RO1]